MTTEGGYRAKQTFPVSKVLYLVRSEWLVRGYVPDNGRLAVAK